ncbi:hypothetical protein NVP2095A_69 [Vibrio phage 2.095.A._10N.286.46.E10]|nr:hypothetical protein NVP2095A_69 [Vibrio phage 2.095.A._10N.286.46.E10]AUS02227.1 hypothetical protein NVP2095B_69 [Vibrio phage 2.095.B._10N.286.46.E10]
MTFGLNAISADGGAHPGLNLWLLRLASRVAHVEQKLIEILRAKQ